MDGPGLSDAPVVHVFRRRGCGYCVRLERQLQDTSLPVRYHDIWADDEARAFVRAHNRGSETVPTVAVGRRVMTNPSFSEVAAAVAEETGHHTA